MMDSREFVTTAIFSHVGRADLIYLWSEIDFVKLFQPIYKKKYLISNDVVVPVAKNSG